jgi:hypothetical protein
MVGKSFSKANSINTQEGKELLEGIPALLIEVTPLSKTSLSI